jgi:RimJ/RimL family protein N-acetyltransferase
LTEPDNEPMLRAARAAGFVDQGMKRRSEVDMIVMTLHRDEHQS